MIAPAEIDWERGPPLGCKLHMAYVDESGLHTIDVWETREGLDAYIERRFDPPSGS